jgi:S-DNA-T family DNA segregation ATPase FtsK/SpoIIIE
VRVVPNLPGKGVMGIEVPNDRRELVSFREVVESEEFNRSRSRLTLGLGKNIEGVPYVLDLAKMPHLLLAGATGMGKSVCINNMLTSILCNATPEEVRLILIDPKVVEFQLYEDVPHLLHPVINEPQKAALALMWAVQEMERRYRLIAEERQRDIHGYNKKIAEIIKIREEASRKSAPSENGEETGSVVEEIAFLDPPEHLPQIVIVIDELADLMMVAAREVETCIARLAQKARAAGIHLILATQRPSTDVITGVIKANLPSRISCKVASDYDSKTIIGTGGAEKLLSKGDMLVKINDIIRVQGAFVSEQEIEAIVNFWKEQASPEYDEAVLQPVIAEEDQPNQMNDDTRDELYVEAVRIALDEGQISISMLQRRMRIGYQRSARIIDWMEKDGVVGPPNHQQKREVLRPPQQL